jgi:hypothetical protein
MNSARCDGWPAKTNKCIHIYIFCFAFGVCGLSGVVSRTQSAPSSLCVCIIMCCGAVFAQNKPCLHTHFWHSARAQCIYLNAEWKSTQMREGTRPLRLFISQYYCFLSVDDSASSGCKICIFCGAYTVLATENSAIHC